MKRVVWCKLTRATRKHNVFTMQAAKTSTPSQDNGRHAVGHQANKRCATRWIAAGKKGKKACAISDDDDDSSPSKDDWGCGCHSCGRNAKRKNRAASQRVRGRRRKGYTCDWRKLGWGLIVVTMV
eukprot:scaffold6856_cov156-Amphora_coffeaeformis.AAC.8